MGKRKLLISKIAPFIRYELGYAAKKNVSVWDLADLALRKHGIKNIPKENEYKYELILQISQELGLKRKSHKKIELVTTGKQTKIANNIKPNSKDFLFTYEWRKVRMQALKKYGSRCQCCGATPKDGVKMNVDHIKPRKTHPELALDINNLQILCEDCNHGKGNWDSTDWR